MTGRPRIARMRSGVGAMAPWIRIWGLGQGHAWERDRDFTSFASRVSSPVLPRAHAQGVKQSGVVYITDRVPT